MKKLIYILLLLPSLGLSQVNLDSLWGVWNDESQPDTNRLKAIKQIAWDGYLFTQPDSAFYFAQLEYNFAKEKGEKEYMVMALNIQGASCYLQSDFDRAIEYYAKSIKLGEEIGDKLGIANTLNNLGVIYKKQGRYIEAIECQMKGLKNREEIGDEKGIASSFVNIGNIYKDLDENSKAIEYYLKSLELAEETGDKRGVANTLNSMGIIYKKQGNYAKAIECQTKSLKIYEELQDKHGMTVSLGNIGNIYKNQNDYNKAKEYHEKSLKLRKEIGDRRGVAGSYINLGNIYYDQKNFTNAIRNGKEALSIAQELGIVPEIKNASYLLWACYKKRGNYKQALTMYELHIESQDSLQSEENQKEVIRQEYKYEYEKQAAADSVKAAEEVKVKDAQLKAEKAEKEKHKLAAQRQKQQQYYMYGGLALALLFGGFIFNRFRITRKQKGIIEEQKLEVDVAYHTLEEKNKEIMDSIHYAKRIQSAILPQDKVVKEYLENSFILYKPKDVVAGDFYWLEHKDNKILFAACDCTGHGVPGAMVSVVCVNGLNRSVREYGLTDPGKILDKTREIVIQEFEKSEDEVKDGMDISLCSISPLDSASTPLSSQSQGSMQLNWAGANNPLWIIRKGLDEVEEVKADKQPIGKYAEPKPFTTHNLELSQGDTIYIFSDGFSDQFGGDKGKKLKSANFKKLLLSIQNETMERQQELIDQAFENWRGEVEQIDDVCVIGVRI